MPSVSKTDSDAYDRVLDAAGELAELIEAHGFALEEEALEGLTIFLANNAPRVRRVLRRCRA
jgi:dsDNA-binding SOS-regulon protein